MRTVEKYKIFLHDKSIDELQFKSSLWISKLEFIAIELSFIKHLLKSYPLKSEIPNLFEQIQLFNKELDIIKKKSDNIIENTHQYINELGSMVECDKLSCDNFYVIAYEKLAKDIFNFSQNYTKLKTQIYEYLRGAF